MDTQNPLPAHSPRNAGNVRNRKDSAALLTDEQELDRVGALVHATCERILAERLPKAGLLNAFFACLLETCELFGRPVNADTSQFAMLSTSSRLAAIDSVQTNLPSEIPKRIGGLDRRIAFLASMVSLDKDEAQIFSFLSRYLICPEYRVFRGFLFPHDYHHSTIEPYSLGLVTGLDVRNVRRAIDPRGRLLRLGLLYERSSNHFVLPTRIKRFLATDASSPTQMRAALLPLAPPSPLSLGDFAHMDQAVEDAIALIRDALIGGKRANLLFYGVPGTGKTELARMIASIIGTSAIEVGNSDEDGDEPSRNDRLTHLRLCRALCSGKDRAILVIDEAEDLFAPQGMQSSSKLWLNRLVEDGEGVHIWIVNSLRDVSEPVIRRMDYALRFTTPSPTVLQRIAERVVRSAQRCDPVGLARDLAALGTSPAVLASASSTADRIGASNDQLLRIARELARATGRFCMAQKLEATSFDPAFSNADHDLEKIAGNLATSGETWSLLLHGVPGTGKSAFAHFIANRAGSNLIVRTGSGLLGPYVGQTEQSIAEAFEQARDDNAILLIDEADDFLFDRAIARHSWEASMVNEMLRQMDCNGVRFIATTNRAGQLDHATARRFTLAVEFKPMTSRQARIMFATTISETVPAGLDAISELTPGDFAQVARRAKLLGTYEGNTICRWLKEAASGRSGGIRAGF